MGKRVMGMHFVCHEDANVVDHGDGTFDTGFWKVATKHCGGPLYVALHESRADSSYRQGRVTGWRVVQYEGSQRIVFTVQAESGRRAWVGNGSGEKGFAWNTGQ